MSELNFEAEAREGLSGSEEVGVNRVSIASPASRGWMVCVAVREGPLLSGGLLLRRRLREMRSFVRLKQRILQLQLPSSPYILGDVLVSGSPRHRLPGATLC